MSENFTIKELTRTSLNLPNVPNEKQIKNIELLCKNILEPIRSKFGAVKINSCFRSSVVNRQVGGAVNSQHLCNEGAAADIGSVQNTTLLGVSEFIKLNLEFDQMIIEGCKSFDKPESMRWLHVSYFEKRSRKEIFIMVNGNMKRLN